MEKSWRERTHEHYAKTVAEQQEALEVVRDTIVNPTIQGILDSYDFSFRPEEPTPSLGAFSFATRFMNSEIALEIDELFANTLLPLSGVLAADGDATVSTLAHTAVGVCYEAESFFSKAVTQVHYGIKGEQDRLTVYHTPERSPVLLQKSKTSASAITLRPIKIRNVVYPPGLLVGVVIDESEPDVTGEHTLKHVIYRTVGIESASIRPKRFSPWAFDDPLDRSLFGINPNMPNEFDGKRARMVRERTLDDFRKAALHIMGLCKPKTAPILPLGLE